MLLQFKNCANSLQFVAKLIVSRNGKNKKVH